ncbi:MAG: AAA family ATPase [Candidatus Cloacimonetes bacterium]|nr:AAA family ATPase [Candidatus Cloacimonadota bacterium]
MEHIHIKNFGPIIDAALEIKDLTVIYGTQAAGKSVIAKLLKVFNSPDLVSSRDIKSTLQNFNMDSYLHDDTYLKYVNGDRTAEYIGGVYKDSISNHKGYVFKRELFEQQLTRSKGNPAIVALNMLLPSYYDEDNLNSIIIDSNKLDIKDPDSMYDYLNTELRKSLIRNKLSNKIYVPSERNIFSLISDNIFSLSATNIPACILNFGSLMEKSRNISNSQKIPFIKGLRYLYESKIDNVEYNGCKIPLPHSASGFQSSIPLALVCNNESLSGDKHFLIEEPEQNLFPVTQHLLVKYLTEKCLSRSNRLLVTTHSPYIISSFDNLIQAGNVGRITSDQKALMKIIPKKQWIDINRVNAYFIDKGKCINMIDDTYNSIDGKYLDQASDVIGTEHRKLLELEYS